MNRERRDERGRRIDFNQAATLTNSDGLDLRIVIKDLSRDGFRIAHGGEDFLIGEPVVLTSARGVRATGQIKWATKSEAGGVFLDVPETFG